MYLTHQDLSNYYFFDVEANDLLPDVSQVWCAVFKNALTKERWRFRDKQDIRRFVEALPKAIWIGHNVLSYDVPVLNSLCGTAIVHSNCIDTLVLSYLYNPAIKQPEGFDRKLGGPHSLGAYGHRMGFPKDTFSDFSRWSQPLEDRCVVDVDIAERLFFSITEKMKRVGFSERSCELEHRIRVIVDRQQDRGFDFNVQAAEQLQARLRETERRLEVPIRELFPPVLVPQETYTRRFKRDGSDTHHYLRHLEQYPEIRYDKDTYTTYDYQIFNIGSPPQRLDKLLSLGFVPTKRTKTGGPSVDEESLVEFAKESGREEVQAIADWLVANGRANMVGTWLDNVGSDGAIHGRVFTCGANSRRMRHTNPNTANIPSNEATYGIECRSLWKARDGLDLVGYDAKAAQMRCFADLLPNPNDGVRFYTDGRDPHQENADLIGIKRKPVKNVFYANMFGAYPLKLATTAGFVGSKKEAIAWGTWIKEEIFRVTPGLREATEAAQAEQRATPEGWMKCKDGGYVRCPTEHAALNYKIQPAEAVLMKQAAVFIDERCKDFEQWKVGDIHDEGQHESNPRCADEVGSICVQAIRDAGEELGFRVPTDGDYKKGKTWADTH